MISYSDFLKGGGAKCKFTKLWHRLEKYNRSWDPGGGGCMTVLGDKAPPSFWPNITEQPRRTKFSFLCAEVERVVLKKKSVLVVIFSTFT